MNMYEFENMPHLMPHLVHLYETHKLYDLAEEEKPKVRKALTNSIAGFFEGSLNQRERIFLSEVLIELLGQAEKDLRQAIAERLACIDTVPLNLILHFVNDEIEIATPILAKSRVLSDQDLAYIVKSKDAAYSRVIAGRGSFGPEVMTLLAGCGDRQTLQVLAENEDIVLSENVIGTIAENAREDEKLAKPLLMRPEVPEEIARGLYRHVGKELREYITAFFGKPNLEAMNQVDDIIVEFSDNQVSKNLPTEAMTTAARRYNEAGLLNMDYMLETLRRGQIASFIAQFSEYTAISPQKLHDLLSEQQPKLFAICCRAHGIQKNDFSRIFLLTHKLRSKSRIVNQRDMLGAIAFFDKYDVNAAGRYLEMLGVTN